MILYLVSSEGERLDLNALYAVVPLRRLTEDHQPNRQSLSPTPLPPPRRRPTPPVPLASNPNPPVKLTTPTERTGGGSRRRRRRKRKMTTTMTRTRTTRLRGGTRPPRGAALNPLPRRSGPAPSVRPPSLTTMTI